MKSTQTADAAAAREPPRVPPLDLREHKPRYKEDDFRWGVDEYSNSLYIARGVDWKLMTDWLERLSTVFYTYH